jgi:predicted O-methyltransferase YrrM
VINRARQIASKSRGKVLRVRPTSDPAYATHLPVLAALARITTIRRVLELGSGPFSTSMFLNRDVFPDLDILTSYEDDPNWEHVVLDAVGSDTRLEFRMVPEVRLAVPPTDGYDLVFIDDSRLPSERSTTIRAVKAMRPRGIVAIHDFEQRHYRTAARGFSHRFIFNTLTPQVGVCWFGDAVDPSQLKRASRTIAGEIGRVSITDQSGWGGLFRAIG